MLLNIREGCHYSGRDLSVRGLGRSIACSSPYAYLAVRALLGLLIRSRRGPDLKDIELMVLRHELDVLRRRFVGPSAVTRAPHRTGALAHGLADIWLTKPDRGHFAGARRRRKPGCRRMREVRQGEISYWRGRAATRLPSAWRRVRPDQERAESLRGEVGAQSARSAVEYVPVDLPSTVEAQAVQQPHQWPPATYRTPRCGGSWCTKGGRFRPVLLEYETGSASGDAPPVTAGRLAT
jgi:hypothetical protein